MLNDRLPRNDLWYKEWTIWDDQQQPPHLASHSHQCSSGIESPTYCTTQAWAASPSYKSERNVDSSINPKILLRKPIYNMRVTPYAPVYRGALLPRLLSHKILDISSDVYYVCRCHVHAPRIQVCHHSTGILQFMPQQGLQIQYYDTDSRYMHVPHLKFVSRVLQPAS